MELSPSSRILAVILLFVSVGGIVGTAQSANWIGVVVWLVVGVCVLGALLALRET